MSQEPIIAIATPTGEGAIGIVRLSGAGCVELLQPYFSGRDLRKAPARYAHFGILYDAAGEAIDEVLITTYRAPASYTGEDSVEISCHGSPYILRQILQLGGDAGARLAQPGEFSQRAFLNGKLDLSQAEAVADLIASRSAAAHRIALQQLRGGVGNEISELRTQLVDFASLIELELDFGEEDVEFADRGQLGDLVSHIRKRITALTTSFRLGNAIKEGVATVIAGRPNAGKSTLLNALLNEDRAIVSDIPGTTRDTIEEIVNVGGIGFRLIDTAGIRDASDTIEAMGVERTLQRVASSHLLVYVFDVVETDPATLAADLDRLYREGLELVVVANKMDLNPYTKYEHYFGDAYTGRWTVPRERFVPMIARDKSNLGYLQETLLQVVTEGRGGIDAQEVILSNARHYDALQRADKALERVGEGLSSGLSQDFIAMDIRQSLRDLGEITGEITTDDLLGNIFSNFCIGK
ncbi:tRNA uridine-5-carboxymethylaminomethyl(34) synthesis GTPase MnmE [Lewinella sp. JB7]|uniref:tRNA uridine-5-carboxymethylaminomethyl(34) synthesis GTPase MnmE n=1 Tax=Lewinella sp. JB7 TaxID=2962887 RepID=UPI0020C9548B|nr:tRNA uridine-5-carboxymethylaminomethyl(34) synthesis GTPase MnmE [Lewinella sp. JB7]MCP9236435.1 tRNA uridine-5-carboxymethylaminomethyl(34) synthesis GTPase MnmE [Lewinella sp. JB7]